MEQNKISVCLAENAQVVFQGLGIDLKNYTTAYGGESAGLDLYNVGPEMTIKGRNNDGVKYISEALKKGGKYI